jgi:uncharacterized protein
VRALLDVNVLISGLLAHTGTPVRRLGKWLEGEFELVVTERLLAELEATLARPKLRRHVDEAEASELPELLRGLAERVEDPNAEPVITSRDPQDDYLIAAAASARATLVTGDTQLSNSKARSPYSPRAPFSTASPRKAANGRSLGYPARPDLGRYLGHRYVACVGGARFGLRCWKRC